MKNCTQELDEIYLAFVKRHFSLSDVLPLYFLFPMYVATPADYHTIFMQSMKSKYTHESRIRSKYTKQKDSFCFLKSCQHHLAKFEKTSVYRSCGEDLQHRFAQMSECGGRAPQQSLGRELRGKLGAPACVRMSLLIF